MTFSPYASESDTKTLTQLAVKLSDVTMTKPEALQAIKTLSALESWALSQSTRLPDYLVDEIQRSMQALERIILEKP